MIAALPETPIMNYSCLQTVSALQAAQGQTLIVKLPQELPPEGRQGVQHSLPTSIFIIKTPVHKSEEACVSRGVRKLKEISIRMRNHKKNQELTAGPHTSKARADWTNSYHKDCRPYCKAIQHQGASRTNNYLYMVWDESMAMSQTTTVPYKH